MHNLTSTAPYPPGQLPPEMDPLELLDGDVGLGFAFAVPALVGAAEQTGALDAVGGFFGDIFGGAPDKDLDNIARWAADIGTGRATPCGGQFSTEEVRRAVAAAPRGNPGDDPGTIEGLRTALVQPMPELAPYVGTTDALARVAVGVAHGRIDCKVGWQEEPAVAHLSELVRRYRAQPAAPSLFERAGGGASPVLASIVPSGVPGFLTLGLLAGAAVYFFQKR